MKQLRRAIQRIILETDGPYEEYSNWEEEFKKQSKLMNLIKSGDITQINPALSLAETLEYISGYTYKEELYDGYSGKKIYHYFELYAPFNEDFIQRLRSTQKYGGKYFELTEPDDEVVVLMFVEKIK